MAQYFLRKKLGVSAHFSCMWCYCLFYSMCYSFAVKAIEASVFITRQLKWPKYTLILPPLLRLNTNFLQHPLGKFSFVCADITQ